LDFSRQDPLEKIGFFGVLDLKFGIPGKTGVMEDRDWANMDNDQLTHFSSHDNYVKGALLLDLFAGVSIPLRNTAYIKVYGVFSYMNFNWASRDGYTQYTGYDEATETFYSSVEEAPKHPVTGPCIDYSQYWFEPALGISVHAFSNPFTVSLSVQVSPYLIARARDDHLQRGDQFVDYMSGGISFKPRWEIGFSPISRLNVSVFIRGILMFEVSGESYMNMAEKPSSFSGASFSALDTGLNIKITL
jgi:outer membrane protease